ncbi:zonular occludens toxin domain-containing protein [Aquitalea magnusonii]|uniref:Zonular occludens toxin Zot n=2 Tax=Aquitalea magnusonii TaxID=332411 RepID=A0A318JMN0_9NEIS|nr:zonular occludens toxin domain-containing protein [Aquitalea magnusonii]PXX51200.1 zonular occludens toxin Zot [Aquitalea magnusonii]
MIYLITATPGSGKTLFTLQWLKEKADNENRQVYYSGIPLSDKGKELLGWIELEDPEKWFELPAEAIVVIDECQRIFGVRRSGGVVPKHVSMFETHRHLGIDVVLITQHPSLMDAHIRKLVGTHRHLVRQFGAQRSTLLTWQEGCQENPNSRSATKSCLDNKVFVFPKEVYSWYKSAEAHTHKFQMPKKLKQLLILAVFVLFALGFLGWKLYQMFWVTPHQMQAQLAPGAPNPQQSGAGSPLQGGAVSAGGKPPKTILMAIQERIPRIPEAPETAPRYDDLAVPRTFPRIVACIASTKKCGCFTQQGTPVDLPLDKCKARVERSEFDPYVDEQQGRRDDRYAEPRNVVPETQQPRQTPLQGRQSPVNSQFAVMGDSDPQGNRFDDLRQHPGLTMKRRAASAAN